MNTDKRGWIIALIAIGRWIPSKSSFVIARRVMVGLCILALLLAMGLMNLFGSGFEKFPHWITLEINDSADEKGEDQRLGIFRIQDGELHLKFEITEGGLRPEGFEGKFSCYKPSLLSEKGESD